MVARGRGHDADRAADRHGHHVDRHRGAGRRLQLGILSVNRARLASTAGALADKQMELYRQAAFTSLTPAALSGDHAQTGSDGRTYWVGTSISWTCVVGPANTTTSATAPTCTGTPASRAVKLVSIEVHQGATSSGEAPLHRERDLRLLDRLTTHST